MKSILKLSIIFVSCILLVSCWDSKNLEELLMIYSVGFDVSKDDPDEFAITIAFPTIVEDAPENKTEVITVSHSLGGAKQNFQNKVYREISYGNTRVIVFSEEVARKGIYHQVDAMLREPLFPATTRFAVVNTRAHDLMSYKPPMSLLVSEFLFDAIRQSNRFTSVPFTTLRNFNHQLFTDGIQPSLPYIVYDMEGPSITINSIALFKEDKMIDILHDKMAMAFMLLKGEINYGFITTNLPEDEDHHISIGLNGGSSKVKTEIIDGKLYINQEIKINATLSEYTLVESVFDPKMLEEFEGIMEQQIDSILMATVERLQENRCDNIGYGLYVRANHPDFFSTEDWCAQLSEAVVKVKSNVKIRTVGISH